MLAQANHELKACQWTGQVKLVRMDIRHLDRITALGAPEKSYVKFDNATGLWTFGYRPKDKHYVQLRDWSNFLAS